MNRIDTLRSTPEWSEFRDAVHVYQRAHDWRLTRDRGTGADYWTFDVLDVEAALESSERIRRARSTLLRNESDPQVLEDAMRSELIHILDGDDAYRPGTHQKAPFEPDGRPSTAPTRDLHRAFLTKKFAASPTERLLEIEGEINAFLGAIDDTQHIELGSMNAERAILEEELVKRGIRRREEVGPTIAASFESEFLATIPDFDQHRLWSQRFEQLTDQPLPTWLEGPDIPKIVHLPPSARRSPGGMNVLLMSVPGLDAYNKSVQEARTDAEGRILFDRMMKVKLAKAELESHDQQKMGAVFQRYKNRPLRLSVLRKSSEPFRLWERKYKALDAALKDAEKDARSRTPHEPVTESAELHAHVELERQQMARVEVARKLGYIRPDFGSHPRDRNISNTYLGRHLMELERRGNPSPRSVKTACQQAAQQYVMRLTEFDAKRPGPQPPGMGQGRAL